jgi:peptide/nickel transport system substrate-binding protein
VQRLLANKSLQHQVGFGPYTFPLVFNETPGRVTADEKVRQALMTAVDPKAYVKAAYGGNSHTGPSFLAPSTRCSDASVAKYLPKPSVANAKSILLSDGYTPGSSGKLQKNGKPLVINLVSTTSTFGQGPEYLSEQWDQLGVSVNFANLDYGSYALALRAGDFDAGTETAGAASPATGSFVIE